MKISGLLLIVFLSMPLAWAAVEAGIEFEETLVLGDGTELVLNGTGIRNKWIFNIYAAGLYLPQKATGVEQVLSMLGPKQVRMVFLYRKVSKNKLASTFKKGFEANHSSEDIARFSNKINQLVALFETVRKGDEVVLSYSPEGGTRIYGNGDLLGTIPGFEFNQALLKIWLGDKPADKELKQGFLGL